MTTIYKSSQSNLPCADINGIPYEFEVWGAEDALDTLLQLTGVLSKPLSSAVLGAATGTNNWRAALAAMKASGGLEATVGHLSDQLLSNRPAVMGLIKKLSAYKVLKNGAPVEFARDYKGDLATPFRVAAACLEVQYGNFFDALRAIGGNTSPSSP